MRLFKVNVIKSAEAWAFAVAPSAKAAADMVKHQIITGEVNFEVGETHEFTDTNTVTRTLGEIRSHKDFPPEEIDGAGRTFDPGEDDVFVTEHSPFGYSMARNVLQNILFERVLTGWEKRVLDAIEHAAADADIELPESFAGLSVIATDWGGITVPDDVILGEVMIAGRASRFRSEVAGNLELPGKTDEIAFDRACQRIWKAIEVARRYLTAYAASHPDGGVFELDGVAP